MCLFFAVASALAVAQASLAQEIKILGIGGDLHSINPQSGEVAFVGFTGHHDFAWNGLAQNSVGEIFSAYGDDQVGFSIYQIDPVTGAGVFILQTTFTGIGSMAFGPGDALYVVNDPVWPAFGGLYELYRLDLTTGAENFIGSTGVRTLLAMDFKGDELYGHSYPEGIIHINTSTGVATDVNPNFRGPNGNTVSLCFDDSGAMYFIDHALWLTSEESGIRHPVDWLSTIGWWGEAVFVEGPKPNLALWLDGTAGHFMQVKMTGATPNAQVGVLWAKGEGGPTPIPSGLPCAGTMMDLNPNMKLLATDTADANGELVIGPGPTRVPAAAAGLIWLQAIDVSTCETSNKILLYF